MSYPEILDACMKLSKKDIRMLIVDLTDYLKDEEDTLFDLEFDDCSGIRRYNSFPVILEPKVIKHEHIINVIPDKPIRLNKTSVRHTIKIVKNRFKYDLDAMLLPFDIIYDRRSPDVNYSYDFYDKCFVRNDGSLRRIETLSKICKNENIRTYIRVIRNNIVHTLSE